MFVREAILQNFDFNGRSVAPCLCHSIVKMRRVHDITGCACAQNLVHLLHMPYCATPRAFAYVSNDFVYNDCVDITHGCVVNVGVAKLGAPSA